MEIQNLRDYLLQIPKGIISRVKSGLIGALCPPQQGAKDNIDIAYFRSLKNLYRGRRGFVIGNGPSLRLGDLELLKNEITVASNKIYLAFPEVTWRPSIYTVADPQLWEKIKTEIPSEAGIIHIPHYLDTKDAPQERIKKWYILTPAGESREKDSSYTGIEFSSDVCNGLYGSWTVTFDNLQLAVHLGLSPIYIIGCDHYYAEEYDVEDNKPIAAGNTNNHFIANYRQPGELVNPAPIRLMDRGYKEARIFSDSTGVDILNATRGGFLEAFRRTDFDSLFYQEE